MNGRKQVITGVKFNCTVATQGAHHVIRLIWPMPPPSDRRTRQPYGRYSATRYSLLYSSSGVCMEQISWSKFLLWLRFEPWTF